MCFHSVRAQDPEDDMLKQFALLHPKIAQQEASIKINFADVRTEFRMMCVCVCVFFICFDLFDLLDLFVCVFLC